jgi:hypothetical protein
LSLSLPSPAALPAPALRPAALPSRPATASVAAPAAPVKPAETPVASVTALSDTMPPNRASEGTRLDAIPDAAVAAPIPLLPSPGSAEVEKAAIPVRPGPGSGGLY